MSSQVFLPEQSGGATSSITPYTGGTNRSTKTAWSSPLNVVSDNDTDATANGSYGSRWLVCTDFRQFNDNSIKLSDVVGANDVVTGVSMRVQKWKSAGAGNITDAGAFLRISSGAMSADQKLGGNWGGSRADSTYAGSFTGTTADLRNPTFGFSFTSDHSTTATSAIDVVEMTVTFHKAPVGTHSGGGTTFVLGSQPTKVDAAFTCSAADSANITGATMTLTGGGTLSFANQNGISGSWNSGVLTLSGTASVANYQLAIRSVMFTASSPGSSSVSTTVNDGTITSTASVKSITASATAMDIYCHRLSMGMTLGI